MKENPFTLMFGKVASSVVERRETIERIANEFRKPSPQIQAYLITGIRGCGKTVVLRETAKRLSDEGWIVLDLNVQGDLIRSYANELYEAGQKRKLFLDWSLSFTVFNISLSVKKKPMSNDPEVIAKRLTEDAFRNGKRILVTIDEVVATESLRYFANFFQAVMGMGLPLCVLMTGIRSNIHEIASDRTMSFLSRAPKIELGPLSLSDAAIQYAQALDIPLKLAAELAKETVGYAFAYQVLGYYCFELKKATLDEELRETYSRYLWQNGYDVIWKDFTRVEKAFLIALAKASGDSANMMKQANMGQSNFQNYRNRLIDKGIIRSGGRGKLEFLLPTFDEFALFMETLG